MHAADLLEINDMARKHEAMDGAIESVRRLCFGIGMLVLVIGIIAICA